MFGLYRWWRRRRLLRRPFPPDWLPIIEERLPFYRRLPPELQSKFRNEVKLFVWEKHFFPAGGLEEVSDEMKVVIAGAAVRLVLHLDLSYYDRTREIVVYPYVYRHPEGEGAILGQVDDWGTVVLSWPAVVHGLANPCDGHDTASHEFAHVLDRAAGRFDGTPNLRATEDYRAWAQVMTRHFEGLREGEPAARQVMRDYGAVNEAEFFAVATESFFEKPWQMRDHSPDLYALLQRFYGFDPAAEPLCGQSGQPAAERSRETME